ncbi:PREDICTED: guanine nucleotide-binding protein G(I)/G(S)/G(O) subunit gamma-12 isoform X1 [Hipposideros armiger]|uniref:Guanine nucleotide-binding protein G(I)/G(S)/G(O) subunit gamma-12 isoform X1 n=1 Tax=Hipposideros armiger TaxID=186990 RepID=A0A8B7RPU2_HIPAR|nr:PREDICTED: guanine nucleotide-binding protein G(I)/G(S)/G(O) subunit gamma-12 isoform X1 [Hipposideros armiger]
MAKAARRLRSFTAPNLTPVPAWTRHASRRPKPGTARASGRERGPGPEEAVRAAAAAAAPPVGLSAPPTSSKAEPAPEQREEEAVEEEERSEPSPGALRDRVPGGGGGGGGGTAHRQIRAQRAAGAADSFPHLKPENGGPHNVLLNKSLHHKNLIYLLFTKWLFVSLDFR